MADASSYCFCEKQYDPSEFMIQCDYCYQWFHGSCVHVKEYDAGDIDKYSCTNCEPRCGPTVYKPILNQHRYDYSDSDAGNKPVQAGTPTFIEQLQSRSFPSADDIVLRLRGQQLTLPYLNRNGFSSPILVETKDGLDLHIPPESFCIKDMEHYVGSDRVMDVIDVTKQADIRMSIAEYVEYFYKPSRRKIYNVISLEFSDTSLSALVSPPYIARKLCWANLVWPHDYPIPRPEVQKYCLMGVQGSYTDFHIDFGGSSVWYHVFKGEKVFYLVEPTQKNLDLYQQWLSRPDHLDVFFGEMVDGCYKLVLTQGQTMFIPTGWIHAVYTSKDSLVFGGNFLHSLNIELQLRVHDIEIATKAPMRFRFPLFQTLHWFAAQKLLQDLRDINSQGMRCPELLARGIRTLIVALRKWALEAKAGQGQEEIELIPEKINVSRLLKELGKELRQAEKNSNLNLSPISIPIAQSMPLPKADRDSTKRIRKKPQARADFIDINEALSNFAAEETRIAKTEKMTNGSSPYDQNASFSDQKQYVSIKKESKDDDDQLVIDERKSYRPAKIEHSRGPIKLRLSVGSRSDFQIAETTEVAANMDIEASEDNDTPRNSINHLLHASACNGSPGFEEFKTGGRTSPSTREAIVGMLSMSNGFSSPSEQPSNLIPVLQQRQRKARKRLHSSLSDDFGDVISRVHQDDDFIYLPLDGSDDEDGKKKKSGKAGRAKLESGDESWNPRAKVGPVVPKTDRPVREGVKRPAVERVLEAAAQRRALESPTKRPYVKRIKTNSSIDGPKAETGSSSTTKPNPLAFASSSASSIVSPTAKTDPKVKKAKKGMATAKQRLGKILKIHKLVH